MNEMKIFNSEEFGKVRTVTIDNEPWFVGKDVCEVFGDTNYRRSISNIDDSDKGVSQMDTPGGKQNMIIINESGLYALLFQMQPQKAKGVSQNDALINDRVEKLHRFKHWVTSEVIPTIRKHGMYATDNVIDKILNNPDFGIELLTKLKEEREARVEAEKKNAILMHVNKTYTMTEIAKELGLKSAIELNKILAEKKIQYKVNGTWVMYSQYSNLGYEEIKQEVLDSGRVVYHRRITQLGRAFILEVIGENFEKELA
jgi:prophage antirepressor-like protein